MNLIEALQKLKEGEAVRNKEWDERDFLYCDIGDCIFRHYTDGSQSPISSDLFVLSYDVPPEDCLCLDYNGWEIYKEPQPILEETEKHFLEVLLRYVNNSVEYIVKRVYGIGDSIICVHLHQNPADFDSYSVLCIPFKVGEEYKNMIDRKEYTLEDLGLFRKEE